LLDVVGEIVLTAQNDEILRATTNHELAIVNVPTIACREPSVALRIRRTVRSASWTGFQVIRGNPLSSYLNLANLAIANR